MICHAEHQERAATLPRGRCYHVCMLRPLASTPADLAAARALLAVACPFDAAARVAEEKLFGPALGHEATALAAEVAGQLAGVVAMSGPCLRLLAVHPAYRGAGVGSALLAAAEAAIRRTGATTVRVLDQPSNYLAPGIDERNHETIAWLGRRGYVLRGHNTNLLVDVRTNPRVGAAQASVLAAACTGYQIRRATSADAGQLTAMITAAFPPGWAMEADNALTCDPPAVHVAVDVERAELVAFAAHDGNNRGLGWFGPTGTLSEHRGRGLGTALLVACLVDVAAAGHERCEVAWIGPRDFYARAVGIAGERRFAVLRKELS